MDSIDADLEREDPSDPLRQAGLRSTPQRRAILSAFVGGETEHLSAEEVYSRATATLPGISRGTVYSALAEFTELGLLAAIGEPEPVRFETNTRRHQHFRCELCTRIFDVDAPSPNPGPYLRRGHVTRISVIAEGTCRFCTEYGNGLKDGAEQIKRESISETLQSREAGSIEIASPLGTMLIAGTADGIARVVFDDHADFDALSALTRNPHGASASWLALAADQLGRYFDREQLTPNCPIDWECIASGTALNRVPDVPYASARSYHLLGSKLDPFVLGQAAGANAVPLFLPCHRIRRGGVLPDDFVGGVERRTWLLDHERAIMRESGLR